MILGAGNLDDIDLNQFSNIVDHITLTDVDKKALEHAKEKYELTAHKVTLKEMEYTGLKNSDHWNNFINKLLLCQTKSEIKQYFFLLKDELEAYQFNFDSTYDMVIVTPIYTQLLLQQMLKDITILASLNYPSQLLDYIQSQALEIMSIVIQTFNKNIETLLHDKSSLCVISDIFEANVDSKFYAQVMPIINDDIKMSDFYEKYLNTYGLGVGDFGLNHLTSSKNIKKSQWFEWPFNKEKSIFVKAICFHSTQK
jgi:hypothetical protein